MPAAGTGLEFQAGAAFIFNPLRVWFSAVCCVLEKEARDGCHSLLRIGLWRRFAEHINSVPISRGERCDSDGWVLALSKGEVRETVQWRH